MAFLDCGILNAITVSYSIDLRDVICVIFIGVPIFFRLEMIFF